MAKFYGDKNGKLDIGDKASLDKIMDQLQSASYRVESVKTGKREKKAPLPFTTSTLQQEASKALNFSIQKTMRIAQQLYEGVDVKGNGTVGLITYLRTDSTRVSDEAKSAAVDFISQNYGEEYLQEGAARQRQTGQKYRMPMRRSVLPISQDCRPRSRTPYPETSSVSTS